MNTIQKLIELYSLSPHPEGGWYKQTYKSSELIPSNSLPDRFTGDRSFSTAIYFLLEQGNFSAFHRIKSDECWHFYAGDPLEVFLLNEKGELEIVTLGNDYEKGQLFQFVVPANCWFASRPRPSEALSDAKGSGRRPSAEEGRVPNSHFSFVGCTVAPGFEFADFELANANTLIADFSNHADIIRQLCR